MLNNEEFLKEVIANYGPVAVAMRSDLIKSYSSGIFNNLLCYGKCDHVMTVVGYGVSTYIDGTGGLINMPYWIIRNRSACMSVFSL